MADVSPGTAVGLFASALLGGLKVLAEFLKWRNAKRLKQAYSESAPPLPQPTAQPALPALTLELQLQKKDVELLRAQYQIDQMTADFRRLREALDNAQRENAQLSARVVEEELRSRQLVGEIEEMIRTGGGGHADTGSRGGADRRERGPVYDPARRRGVLRPEDR